jgi:hypothetical protein
MKKAFLSIIISTIWISISEFLRNSFLVHEYWVSHYQKLSIEFPENPLNGAVWGVWALCFSIAIYIISRKFSIIQTTFLSWFMGFVLMWLVIGNLSVLPMGTLFFAIPLSLLETLVATIIIKKLV